MSFTIKNNSKIAVVKETTAGTYAAPASGTDYLQVLADGMELTPSRETLERNVLGTGLGKIANRTGLKSVAGSIPVELRAGSTEGSEPEYHVLLESLLGGKKTVASITTGVGHTASVIAIADTSTLSVGDIVVVKNAGSFHTSPIKAITSNESIELLVPCAAAPADNVELAAFINFYAAETGHSDFSVSKYVEDAVLEKAMGCKCTSMSLEGFTTGQVASLNFSIEGADFDRKLESPAHSPSFTTSNTPIILQAVMYQNGEEISVNEFTLNIENTLGWIQNTNHGKISSRVTARSVAGTINPYKRSDSIEWFNKFNKNEPFSLFVSAHNPTEVEGEYKEVVAFYMPKCIVNDISESDQDGVLTDSISFSCHTTSGEAEFIFVVS